MFPELLFSLRAKSKDLSDYLFKKSLDRLLEEQKITVLMGRTKPFSGIIDIYKNYEFIICQYTSEFLGNYNIAFSEDGYVYIGIILDTYPVKLTSLDTKSLESLLKCELFEKEPVLYPYCPETWSVRYNQRMDVV